MSSEEPQTQTNDENQTQSTEDSGVQDSQSLKRESEILNAVPKPPVTGDIALTLVILAALALCGYYYVNRPELQPALNDAQKSALVKEFNSLQTQLKALKKADKKDKLAIYSKLFNSLRDTYNEPTIASIHWDSETINQPKMKKLMKLEETIYTDFFGPKSQFQFSEILSELESQLKQAYSSSKTYLATKANKSNSVAQVKAARGLAKRDFQRVFVILNVLKQNAKLTEKSAKGPVFKAEYKRLGEIDKEASIELHDLVVEAPPGEFSKPKPEKQAANPDQSPKANSTDK